MCLGKFLVLENNDSGALIRACAENGLGLLFMSQSLLECRTSSCGFIHFLLSGCFPDLWKQNIRDFNPASKKQD